MSVSVHCAVSESREDLVGEMMSSGGGEIMPAVKHYELKEFSGMFEYSNKDDELTIVKRLILGSHIF